jgi:uncharacterized membrane protein
MLVSGILLWSVTHLFVALGVEARRAVIARIGARSYRSLFALTQVLALTLIVMGWKAASPASLYVPPPGLRHLTLALMPLAIILFISSRAPSDIKQVIRHPQLAAVKLWAVLHLLANGEVRSVILFGGMLAWAVLEVIFINRRDGAWIKPAPAGAARTAGSAAVGLAIAVLVMLAHRWFTGVPVIGMGF